MARQHLTSKTEESIHVGPGRPGKGQKTLPPGGREDSRRNGKKITILVTAAEKAAIDAARSSNSESDPVGYAAYFLSLIAEKDERESQPTRPALISEALERIDQLGETASDQVARLRELNDSIDRKFGAQLAMSKQLEERVKRHAAETKGLEALVSAQSNQLAQLTTAQVQLNKTLGQITESLLAVATGFKDLTESVHSLSRVSNPPAPGSLPRPQSIPSPSPIDRQRQPPLGAKPTSGPKS